MKNSIQKIKDVYVRLTDDKSRELFTDLLLFRITLDPKDLPEVESDQYYPSGNFWKLDSHEKYVDVGAYNGDSLLSFFEHTKYNFDKYYAIEADPINYNNLIKIIPEEVKDKIVTICKGAGSKNLEVYFEVSGQEDSAIVKEGTNKIQIITLDSLINTDFVTTIKIDVEGYEPEVLEGAKNIIKRDKPKIALSVYHNADHLWELPLQLLRIRPDYQLYLRHHQYEIYDTVLYAI